MRPGPKKISDQQVLGEQGAALVDERTHAMGFLFKRYGSPEAGIDGLIELRNPTTGHVGGRLIAVQVKTRQDRPYTAETEDGFEYLCDLDDVAYWGYPRKAGHLMTSTSWRHGLMAFSRPGQGIDLR